MRHMLAYGYTLFAPTTRSWSGRPAVSQKRGQCKITRHLNAIQVKAKRFRIGWNSPNRKGRTSERQVHSKRRCWWSLLVRKGRPRSRRWMFYLAAEKGVRQMQKSQGRRNKFNSLLKSGIPGHDIYTNNGRQNSHRNNAGAIALGWTSDKNPGIALSPQDEKKKS